MAKVKSNGHIWGLKIQGQGHNKNWPKSNQVNL